MTIEAPFTPPAHMKPTPFDNSYLHLGSEFYQKIGPTPVANPTLIRFNESLAEALGIAGTELGRGDCVDCFAGNRIPEGAEPLAMVYAGHQFGGFNPRLGDGRAILLGEVVAPSGQRYDIQLKGSGRTRFSRNGDGRSALGPVLREYLVSEAMAALGVPTTRALAAVSSGETVRREGFVPGGILTRISGSLIRVGTFEYFRNRGDAASIKKLADYVIQRSYPEIADSDNRYLALLDAIVDRQARLIARWMQLGFIHGVMNTDNMSIAGETIDYGPCAFMDGFNWRQVYSSIDHQGRYAYANQPPIALWNLTRLAETLLPLLMENDDDAQAAIKLAETSLERFRDLYHGYWLTGMREKLGLATAREEDEALINDLLDLMESRNADYTLTFHYLSRLLDPDSEEVLSTLFGNANELDQWLTRWRSRLQAENASDRQRQLQMQATNPVYIPRNHQIEAAIRAAEDQADFSLFHALHEVLQKPFDMQPGKSRYMQPPRPEEVVHQTFCGT